MSRNLRSVIRLAMLIMAALSTRAAYAQPQSPRPSVVRDVAAELACAPNAVETLPVAPMTVVGGQIAGKVLFGTGETILVRVGSALGVRYGEEYFVRRVVPDRFTKGVSDGVALHSIHTAGWIRVVEVEGDTAVATVTHACDAVTEGDYLEKFEMPVVPAATASGEPDFANPGRIILGDERRQMGSVGSMLVFDRGSDHGLRPGQRVTIFRPVPTGTGPVVRIGDGTAMVVRPETTTLRIDKSIDTIYVGDLVAIHR
jgi:hypothetical protein